jgi:hypothetical protein
MLVRNAFPGLLIDEFAGRAKNRAYYCPHADSRVSMGIYIA